ncbi:dihydrofolate reductase family protein [Xanthovirga aplysinae]|uniref:dihydrofolate reductase family protein n=1 Tax=Xanthovirga aplysinae TaxID=2529853 RepID=UPI0012BBC166|nr:dihydrofolate reductase family protein [Xanthovirga aplysinae]MTI31390.1 dihydrofolate reductase [Xanthovirga aplysinae]
MRKLAILTFQTLDGVMQAPKEPEEDKSNGFEQGGWADPYWDKVMAQVREEAMAEPYDLLLGRKTYELFAPHFSNLKVESEGNLLNDATKYVATNTLKKLDWQNSFPIRGDIAKQVAGLKSQDGPLLQVHGSWQLIQTLLKFDLVDEYRLWTFPLILGEGKRLFQQGLPPKNLTLLKSASTSNGVGMSIYGRD